MTKGRLQQENRKKRSRVFFSAVLLFSDGLLLTGIFSSGSCRTWLVLLCSTLISLVLMLPAAFLLKKADNPLLLRITVFLISLAAVFINLRTFDAFIRHCLLPASETWFLLFCIVLTALFGAVFRDTLHRSLHLLVPFLAFFLLLAAVLALTEFHLQHFKYLPVADPADIFSAMPLAVLILCARILLLLYYSDAHSMKYSEFLWGGAGILFTEAVTIVLLLIATGVLGGGLYEQLQYPLFYPLGLTSFGDYMERAEVLSAALLMIFLVLKLCTLFQIMKKSLGINSAVRKQDR